MKKYWAMVGIIIIMVGCCGGCSSSEKADNQVLSDEIDTLEENGEEAEIAERQKFLDIYYPIMEEYNKKADDFFEATNTLKDYYEECGHNYGDLSVIDQMDIYYDMICEKYEIYINFLMTDEFFNDNIALFGEIFYLSRYEDIVDTMNDINENYDMYRPAFLNGEIVAGGALEGANDIGFLYISNARELSTSLMQILTIKLEPKETCYEEWLEYRYSIKEECEKANQQLMSAWTIQEDSNDD